MEQYSKPISHIRSSIAGLDQASSESNIKTDLFASLLYFSIEIFQKDNARARFHLRRGLRILYEQVQGQDLPARDFDSKRVIQVKVTGRETMDLFTRTFIRLDADGKISFEESFFLRPVGSEEIPASLSCVNRAIVHLDVLLGTAFEISRDLIAAAVQQLTNSGCILEYDPILKRSVTWNPPKYRLKRVFGVNTGLGAVSKADKFHNATMGNMIWTRIDDDGKLHVGLEVFDVVRPPTWKRIWA